MPLEHLGQDRFRASAIAEVLTGLAFLVAPTLVVGLLLGEGVSPIGVAVARVLMYRKVKNSFPGALRPGWA